MSYPSQERKSTRPLAVGALAGPPADLSAGSSSSSPPHAASRVGPAPTAMVAKPALLRNWRRVLYSRMYLSQPPGIFYLSSSVARPGFGREISRCEHRNPDSDNVPP